MFGVIKELDPTSNGLDRKNASSLMTTIFAKKWNIYRFNKSLINHLNKLQRFITSSTNSFNPHLVQIDQICTTMIYQTLSDINKYEKLIKPYVNNDNIKETAFWTFLNNSAENAFKSRSYISSFCILPHLIDEMKQCNDRNIHIFLKSHFDNYSSSEFEKNLLKHQVIIKHQHQHSNNHSSPPVYPKQPKQPKYVKSPSYPKQSKQSNKGLKDRFNKMIRLIKKTGGNDFPKSHCLFCNDGNQCKKVGCTYKHICASCDGKHCLTQCTIEKDAEDQEDEDVVP